MKQQQNSVFRDEIKNRIRETADIVQVIGECVELKKAGTRFTARCPFHAEKTPSFSVNPQGQFFHCFGCGESGDVFSFLMKYHHLSFPEALKDLARRYNIDLPEPKMSDQDRARLRQREQLYRVNKEASAIYHDFLQHADAAASARAYLQKRGVPDDMLTRYRLGYTPPPETAGWEFITKRLQEKKISLKDIELAGLAVAKENGGYYDRFRDRVLFPIYDHSGREVAFGGRILGEGKPKYMNSPESMIFDKSRLLFGLFQHRDAIRKSRRALVVEGNFDLLLLAVHGVENVVAPLGTALTSHHIKSLRGYCDEVVLLFDGDSAGLKAARRSIPFFLAEQVAARVAVLPPEHDPDTLVREQGTEGINRLIDQAKPLAEFVFSSLAREHGLTLSGKNIIMRELAELINHASDPSQRELMISHFSEKLGISPAHFNRSSPKNKPPSPRQVHPEQPKSFGQLERRQRQLIDFLVLFPDFLQELQQSGINDLQLDPLVNTIIDSLQQLNDTGQILPEKILSVIPETIERQYITDLLMRGPAEDIDGEQQGRKLCDELICWIQSVKRQQTVATIQQQINDAQQAGDTEQIMKLLKTMQKIVRESP